MILVDLKWLDVYLVNIFFLLDAYLCGFMYSLYKKSWTPSNRKAYLHNFVTLQCRFWWINPLNQNYLLILKHALFSIIQAVTFSNQGGSHLNLLVFPFVYQFNWSVHHLQINNSPEEFQHYFCIVSKFVCCGVNIKKNVLACTLISFAVYCNKMIVYQFNCHLSYRFRYPFSCF